VLPETAVSPEGRVPQSECCGAIVNARLTLRVRWKGRPPGAPQSLWDSALPAPARARARRKPLRGAERPVVVVGVARACASKRRRRVS
jgi:hypothetical protein